MKTQESRLRTTFLLGDWLHKISLFLFNLFRTGAVAAVPVFFFLSLVIEAPAVSAEPAFHGPLKSEFLRGLKNGGAYVADARGRELLSHRADETFVPASTLKIATAACALKLLGPDFRFTTELYTAAGGILGIRGFADPTLTSEEIARMAAELRAQLPHGFRAKTIVVDSSFFAEDLVLDGYEGSKNPYDALPTAVAANFNTLNLHVGRKGEVRSAEPETPLTELGLVLGKNVKRGTTERINLSKRPGFAERYFAELFIRFLRIGSGKEAPSILIRKLPPDAKLLLRYRSSQILSDLLPPMLEFSTNFTANEIFLFLGAHKYGPPATAKKASSALEACLREQFHFTSVTLFDGAGLSHRNRVTPRDFGRLLAAFAPHRGLLRIDRERFQAKTGSLRGVNTYAGYFDSREAGEIRFVIFVNDRVPFEHKWRLAELLYSSLH